MIAIINYGMGNLNSVKKAFVRVGADVVVTDNHELILKADKLVLPGVGNFEKGMEKLESTGLRKLLDEAVLVMNKPILGICLGMQLFTSFSEEGNVEGMNWIPGKTNNLGKPEFRGKALPVPHMGWNDVQMQNEHPVFSGIPSDATFYFVHSYAVDCENNEHVVGRTFYGKSFDSVIARNNIIGTQFHPEKSHHYGLKIIENYCKL